MQKLHIAVRQLLQNMQQPRQLFPKWKQFNEKELMVRLIMNFLTEDAP